MTITLAAFSDRAGLFFAITAVLVAILVVVTFVLLRQWSMLRRNLTLLKRGASNENMVELVARHVKDVQSLAEQFDGLMARYDYLLELLQGSAQRIALVRYDAFEDMGGKLSYSAALLDDNGNGIIFTSIYARNENRTYAKPVVEGRSTHTLSREEEESLRRAMRYKPKIIRSGGRTAASPFDMEMEDMSEFTSVKGEDETWVM
ncbi:MAG: DUF4446 family protein [Candidatus Geothermincolia bacterium]